MSEYDGGKEHKRSKSKSHGSKPHKSKSSKKSSKSHDMSVPQLRKLAQKKRVALVDGHGHLVSAEKLKKELHC